MNREPSKTTDKLELLTAAITKLPPKAFENIRSFQLDWKEEGGTPVPVINVEYDN